MQNDGATACGSKTPEDLGTWKLVNLLMGTLLLCLLLTLTRIQKQDGYDELPSTCYSAFLAPSVP